MASFNKDDLNSGDLSDEVRRLQQRAEKLQQRLSDRLSSREKARAQREKMSVIAAANEAEAVRLAALDAGDAAKASSSSRSTHRAGRVFATVGETSELTYDEVIDSARGKLNLGMSGDRTGPRSGTGFPEESSGKRRDTYPLAEDLPRLEAARRSRKPATYDVDEDYRPEYSPRRRSKLPAAYDMVPSAPGHEDMLNAEKKQALDQMRSEQRRQERDDLLRQQQARRSEGDARNQTPPQGFWATLMDRMAGGSVFHQRAEARNTAARNKLDSAENALKAAPRDPDDPARKRAEKQLSRAQEVYQQTNERAQAEFDRHQEGKGAIQSIGRGLGRMANSNQAGDVLSGAGETMQGVGLATGNPAMAVVGTFAKVLGESVEKLRRWGDALHESNMKFAEFSGGMSLVQAQQQERDIRLNQQRGDFLAPSARRAAEAQSRFNRNVAPMEDAWTQSKNEWKAIIFESLNAVLEKYFSQWTNQYATGQGEGEMTLTQWTDRHTRQGWDTHFGRPGRFFSLSQFFRDRGGSGSGSGD